MKNFLLIIFVIIGHTTLAQSPKIGDVKIYKDTVLYQHDFAMTVPGSTFLFENDLGKVYKLPLDNMKCLSPNIQSNMPVYKGKIELNRLPNPQIKPVPIPNPFSKNPPVIFTKPYRVPLK